MWAWIVAGGLHRGAWRPWDAASFHLRGQLEILRLGLPMGVQLALESCAFTLATFMAGWLDLAALGSHQIVLNMAALAFMLPLGISMSASARVGNLIGAGDHAGMRRSVRAALFLGAATMSLSALLFTLFDEELPRLYTNDVTVLPLATAILPIAAAFQLADGTQVVAGGVLRGMGRPNIAAAVNLVGYYALALPLAYVLGFPLGHRLIGIWLGLAVGLFAVAIALALWAERTSRRPLTELAV
jgi:MATE family multidrug resistance protein